MRFLCFESCHLQVMHVTELICGCADPMTKGLLGNKFNARAVRSFEYLEARAKRLEGIIAKLKESGDKTIDINISPRGVPGPMGPPGRLE